MDKPFYQFTVLNEARRFDFVSVGKEEISKTITFSKTEEPDIYTLMLANVRPNGSLDIRTVSNNGDMKKILVTVYKAIEIFLTDEPDAIVIFSGSSDARTRLYQISISKELSMLNDRFKVYGVTKDGFELFRANQRYCAFVISLKNTNIV
ncbi:hypothetical protein L0663_04610 [Dyadobacter sp. CY107]|uniref:DUF6934 family protein n=1 Tax=Dyadobacter fanqingshengii TaxID=2906443 RepID=UPI001F3DC622|nr:hypothetical protein [Dyadobacter fanqingshengii]MCF2502647.1 hypothetical protein [Dyadobacter fanqingshengii]